MRRLQQMQGLRGGGTAKVGGGGQARSAQAAIHKAPAPAQIIAKR